MARSRYAIETSVPLHQPVRFRGIDGRELAQQYLLNREFENYRQGGQWHHPSKWQGKAGMTVLPTRPEGLYTSAGRPDESGLLRRFAIWLSKVGAA